MSKKIKKTRFDQHVSFYKTNQQSHNNETLIRRYSLIRRYAPKREIMNIIRMDSLLKVNENTAQKKIRETLKKAKLRVGIIHYIHGD